MGKWETKDKAVEAITNEIYRLQNEANCYTPSHEVVFDTPCATKNFSSTSRVNDFITSIINGDKPIDFLALTVTRNDKKIILLYILTNLRIIKIDIDTRTHEIDSNTYPLNTIIGIERKLTPNGIVEFSIAFQNGNFGLRYSNLDTKITEFFQKIEQPHLGPSI